MVIVLVWHLVEIPLTMLLLTSLFLTIKSAEMVPDDVLIDTFYLGVIEVNLLEKDN